MPSLTPAPRSWVQLPGEGRLAEWWVGRATRGAVVFTSTRRRMTSVIVRGDQMAEEVGGICVRHRYLRERTAATSPAVIWIVEADMERVNRLEAHTPQILDVINPAYPPDRERFAPLYAGFRYLILNTSSSERYLGSPQRERRCWVIPHHHCNSEGWRLPEERVARPKVVGYVGQAVHLHDADAIRDRVESLGMRFAMLPETDLAGYREIDIGVAWTHRDAQRDETRSNIKLSNFAAHGIPSVVCDYESYRDVNRTVGEVGLISETPAQFLDRLGELATNEGLRRTMAARGPLAQSTYARSAIASMYRSMISEIRSG